MRARIRNEQQLIHELSRLLEARPGDGRSALQSLSELLVAERGYEWVAIHALAGRTSHQVAAAGTENLDSGFSLTPIKIAGRVLGKLEVAGSRRQLSSYRERVLLKRVAALIARFLRTRGQAITRKLRSAALEQSPEASAGKLKPAFDRGAGGAHQIAAGAGPSAYQARRASGPRA